MNHTLRIKKIGYKLKRPMETLLVCPVPDMGTKEAQVHEALAKYKVRGEWFSIPDDYVDTLKGAIKGVGISLGESEKGKARASSSSSISSSSSKCRGTLEELKDYCKSIGLHESDGDFMFHKWEESGWKNSGSPVKDWKAGIRKWKSQGWLPSQKVQQLFTSKESQNYGI